jgi:hypothetical protein
VSVNNINMQIDAMDLCENLGWTDGLPVVPPTKERVQRVLTGTRRAPDELICRVPPAWGRATVERIAINAAMAGCRPEHLPVVIAALEALMDPKVNLHGVQCTTHVSTPLLIINGPIRERIGVNSGHNCFGQGTLANAVIGRAIRLVMTNIGGAKPGEMDKATFGHPGKYSYCTGENEEVNPWEPFHVEHGFKREDSTVTVFAAEAPHNVNNHGADNPFDLLRTIASVMATLGNNNMYLMSESFIVLGQEHADIIAREGWTKNNVKSFIFEHARRPIKELKMGGMYSRYEVDRNIWPRWIEREDDNSMVPVARRPEDINIIVAGGAGRHSLVIPGWGTRASTRKIED